MMTQRTLNIINILKGNTKYYGLYDDVSSIDAIKQYMSEECFYQAEWYSDTDMLEIMYEAMLDYLDHCAKPSAFMLKLSDLLRTYPNETATCIGIALSLVQVRDANGYYVNGFDDRIHNLDKENTND